MSMKRRWASGFERCIHFEVLRDSPQKSVCWWFGAMFVTCHHYHYDTRASHLPLPLHDDDPLSSCKFQVPPLLHNQIILTFLFRFNLTIMKLRFSLQYPSLSLLIVLFYTYFSLTVQAQPTSDIQYSKLSRPLTVAILLLLFIFFIILFFSLYIRHYLELNAASDAIIQAAGRVYRFGACHGLDPAEIRAFPVVAHSAIKEMKMGKWWLECAVCLTEFQHYETLRLLPKCGHVFHPACIDAWLASCATCPICRAELAAGENCSTEFVAIDVVDRNGDDGRNGEVLDNWTLKLGMGGGGGGGGIGYDIVLAYCVYWKQIN